MSTSIDKALLDELRRLLTRASALTEALEVIDDAILAEQNRRDQWVAERIRKAPDRRGRKKDEQAVALAVELWLEGKHPAEIRLELERQLGVERSERSIRRWIKDMGDQR